MEAQPWIISVLSTNYDLHKQRESLIGELKSHGILVSAFELPEFPVEPNVHCHDACLIALNRVDICIVMIDKRWGDSYIGDDNVSITEQEYLTSIGLNKIVIPFVSKNTWDELYKYNESLRKSKTVKADFDAAYKCEYVESTKVFDFVEKIKNSAIDNWINPFEDKNDLLEKVIGKIRGLSRYFCERIIIAQKTDVESRHTSTGLSMSLGDVIRRGYYIEPTYQVDSGQLIDIPELDASIVNTLKTRQSILLIGEAGFGKTTILAKCFLAHVASAIDSKDYFLPFYLMLKAKGSCYHFSFADYISNCFEIYLMKLPYPFMDLSTISPVFYMDGFDELAEKISEFEINTICKSQIFQNPMLLTSRQQYANRYLNNFNFSNIFDIRISVKTWDNVKAKQYIDAFCVANHKDTCYSSKIKSLIFDNADLRGIVDNPLLITMFLWIVERKRMAVPATINTRVRLFEACIDELAKRELDRSENKKLSSENIATIWSYVAWEVYLAKVNSKYLKITTLSKNLQKYQSVVSSDHLYLEALFDCTDDTIIGTFHEQFLEFLVAKTIHTACVQKEIPFPEFLELIMRPEINRYFRQLWIESDEQEQEQIVLNLKTEYFISLGNDENRHVARRTHAIYHIARLDSRSRNEIIDQAFSAERHISVRLSLYFGAIKMGRMNDEEEFYRLLVTDANISKANRGYHLAYYSDSIMPNDYPFIDDEKVKWDGTLRAILKHFGSEKFGHYYLRRIELVTIRHLMEVRQQRGPLTAEVMVQIGKLIVNPNITSMPEFQSKIIGEFDALNDSWHAI